MSGTTNVTIRMDTKLRNEAEDLFSDFGLSLSAAMIMFLKQAVREQRIPFEVKRDIPNADTIAAIEEAKIMDKNPDRYKKFDSIDDLTRN